MTSLADGLPPDVAARVHPDRRANESAYWATRDGLLPAYRGLWVAFADGGGIAWALSQKGRAAEGLKMTREGFALYERLGTSLVSPVFCVLLADCCSAAGDPVKAAAWAARGRAMVERNNERLSLPGVLMMDGQLMQRAADAASPGAESCYRKAHECARAQGAPLRELQAGTLLAQSLMAQGRGLEAAAVLAPYRALIASPTAPDFLRPLAALFESSETVSAVA